MNPAPYNGKRSGARTPDRFGNVPLERGFLEHLQATTVAPIDKVFAALEPYDVRPSGAGWEARCPVPGHGKGNGDLHPSLHFRVTADGRVLIRCQAGCNTADVLTASRLTFSDLYPEPRQSHTAPRPTQQPRPSPPPTSVGRFRPVTGWTLAAVFEFYGADGVVIATKARYERIERTAEGIERRNKTFRSAGAGHVWPNVIERGEPKGEAGVQLPLYRLPDLLTTVERGGMVYMTEGEAKADAVADHLHHHLGRSGAVTSYGGHWRRDHAHTLRGASLVVLLPDGDIAGRNKARAVWDDIRTAGVPCIIAPSVTAFFAGLDGMPTEPPGEVMPNE